MNRSLIPGQQGGDQYSITDVLAISKFRQHWPIHIPKFLAERRLRHVPILALDVEIGALPSVEPFEVPVAVRASGDKGTRVKRSSDSTLIEQRHVERFRQPTAVLDNFGEAPAIERRAGRTVSNLDHGAVCDQGVSASIGPKPAV